MPFRTPLSVRHDIGEEAAMLGPEGDTVIEDEQLERLPIETLESAY